jgi:glycosyltransferase involved in cell wall biosynthesis
MPEPVVSVVMPVYNAERHLRQAVESILKQTYRDFEFVIVDDGSTDGSSAILDEYEKTDSRVRLYKQDNHGLVFTLNRVCGLARGEYIARMDADDICFPTRLEEQVEFMTRNPRIGILGTWAEAIDEAGTLCYYMKPPTTPETIRWSMVFTNPVVHSSVMMRRTIGESLDFYRPETFIPEDFFLWMRALQMTQLTNLPRVLLKYRIMPQGFTAKHLEVTQPNAARLIQQEIAKRLNTEVSIDVARNIWEMAILQRYESISEIRAVDTLIEQLYLMENQRVSLSDSDLRFIRNDVAVKFRRLAKAAFKRSTWYAMKLGFKAIKLEPLLALRAMCRIVLGQSRIQS